MLVAYFRLGVNSSWSNTSLEPTTSEHWARALWFVYDAAARSVSPALWVPAGWNQYQAVLWGLLAGYHLPVGVHRLYRAGPAILGAERTRGSPSTWIHVA
jgi:hypothetical protein